MFLTWNSTLAEELGAGDAHEEELYAAINWLIEARTDRESGLAVCEHATG